MNTLKESLLFFMPVLLTALYLVIAGFTYQKLCPEEKIEMTKRWPTVYETVEEAPCRISVAKGLLWPGYLMWRLGVEIAE